MCRENRVTVVIGRDECLNQLTRRRRSPYIKIATGARRCGKSFLLRNLYRDWCHGSRAPER